MATATKVLNYEEWLELPENDERRKECVNGVIEELPWPPWNHAVIISTLDHQFWEQPDRSTTIVVSAGFNLVIRKYPVTARVPDLAVFVRDRMIIQDGYVHSPPELVIEVRSASNTPARLRQKAEDYKSISIPEFWVVDPDARTIRVHILENGDWKIATLGQDAVVSPVRFPSVKIDFSSVWA